MQLINNYLRGVFYQRLFVSLKGVGNKLLYHKTQLVRLEERTESHNIVRFNIMSDYLILLLPGTKVVCSIFAMSVPLRVILRLLPPVVILGYRRGLSISFNVYIVCDVTEPSYLKLEYGFPLGL